MSDGPLLGAQSAQQRYEVFTAFASGGMATIHRAFDRWSQREIAYKRARFASEANRARMTALFRREFDTLARLAHPNIVAVHDFGFDAQGPYYTMELLTGEDLAQRAPLPYREVCRVMRDVASALALVHARRLVHRDISPNNVRLTAEGHAKLLDFGGLTSFGAASELVGTPAFIAPECLRGEAIDGRADLYGLGALMYWTLTRRLAVAAHTLDQLESAWALPIAAPSQFVPAIPAELDALVLSLLQRDAQARPACAGEVIERLTELGELEPERHEDQIALSYLKHTPLEGRDETLTVLSRKLDALAESRGSALVIEGGPGSGRSALLHQLAIEAQLRGMAILSAEGKIHGQPLSAATHLAESGLALYPELERAFRGRRSSFSEASEDRSAMRAAERHAMIAASLKELLLAFAARGPLVITIDDADAVDEASLALLASLAEDVGDRRIVLALTRGTEPPRRDAEALLRAGANRLTVGALSVRDLTQLTLTMFGDVPNARVLASWLHRQSGGNPAHCLELVAMLLRRGTLHYTRGTFTLPSELEHELGVERVDALLLDRLSGIAPQAERLTEVLALSQSALSVDQLVAASGLGLPEVVEGLRQLRERSLSVEASERHNLASPALRRRIEEALPAPARRALHLALARVLGAPSGPLEDRLQAGIHRIRGGEEREGADAIGQLAHANIAEVGIHGGAIAALESALAVYSQLGYADVDCVHLLLPLTVSGFYGELGAQRRHFDRTIRALARLSGIAVALRLRPWLGRRLALLVGILVALLWGALRRSRTVKASLRSYLEYYVSIITTSTAAAACAIDTVEAERVVAWLEPLADAPPESSLQIARQFSLAVVETSAGHSKRALERYEDVLERIAQPVRGMSESTRQQLRHGSLHGVGQAAIDIDLERARVTADALARDSVYFAPHAESIRMTCQLYRGERTAAEAHRARAEALALLGGVSWSSVVLLTARAHVGALLSDDVVTLVRVAAELQRLSHLSPALALQCELAHADLARLRGQPGDALPVYERVLRSELGKRLPTRPALYQSYARTLCEVGRPEAALRLCDEAIADFEASGAPAPHRYLMRQQRALAQAAHGDLPGATSALEALVDEVGTNDNPLIVGGVHRDRAQLALIAGDAAAFERSFLVMKQAFARTENPYLLRQCEGLHSRAVRRGVRDATPSSETSVSELVSTLDGETAIESFSERPAATAKRA